jgi:tryptophan halogenase
MSESDMDIRDVVVVGGGTAGWMAAAAFSRFLANGSRRITLVESDEIGIVGVGEATIPPILNFLSMLGINENEMMRAARATFKLGIEFVNWGKIGDRYIHPFGHYGQDLHGVAFHQLYLREIVRGAQQSISSYSMSAAAAAAGRFARPSAKAKPPLNQLFYAFHFDASLFARFLRSFAERNGVVRREGRIVGVRRRETDGYVESLELASGERVGGELFIDCSGFRALLIGETLGVGYEDWSHWLQCDRAIALPTANVGPPDPFTRATAHGAGWQWRIPLQHRTGNGHVYSSRFLSDDEAEAVLRANLEGEVLAPPRLLRFRAGQREKAWSHNVVALGLSSGFLEPLESTSIHLIQNAISRLFTLFPDRSFSELERNEFNRGMREIYEDVRDFIILHYKATQRDDTPFWRNVRDMDIPEPLQRKIELFRARGRIFREGAELFGVTSWVAVMLGQGIWPERYDTLVDSLDESKVAMAMAQIREACAEACRSLPSQEEFLRAAGAWAPELADQREVAAQ